jgi:3-phenylpropionate/trans-cinnamate dioxygenase ferredoxin reductase component
MNTQSDKSIVIVGAGHAGGSLAAFLRQYGHKGRITLIGDEVSLPYHRPPLSKAWLKGEVTLESLYLKPQAFYESQNIELVLGSGVTKLDPEDKVVHLSDGESLHYDELVIATGANSRRLNVPGSDLDNVFYLRNIEDAKKLAEALRVSSRLAVIGGGYIGLECAATARALGIEVTLFERTSRTLERVASEPLSTFLTKYHASKGVEFCFEASVAEILGTERASGVRLADGRVFECDAVLVGVGAIPNVELAIAAGLECSNGIVVDEACRTALPSVFAIGDVAMRPHPLFQRNLRIESVPSAMEQAKRVASVLTGKPALAAEQPWFWSDQYDLKLQMVGLLGNASQYVVRGDVESGKFCIFHFSDDNLVAAEAVNASAEFFAAKKLIGREIAPSRERLSDVLIPLNEFVN